MKEDKVKRGTYNVLKIIPHHLAECKGVGKDIFCLHYPGKHTYNNVDTGACRSARISNRFIAIDHISIHLTVILAVGNNQTTQKPKYGTAGYENPLCGKKGTYTPTC